MLKKRKQPRKLRRIELKINNITLVIKHPTKWTAKVENSPLLPVVNDIHCVFNPFDIHCHAGLVRAATGKRLEEIIEEQERIESQANAIRRMYNFWVKGEV